MTPTEIMQIIGLTTVVVSLLFVAYQIRQANRIAKVTTEYEIRTSQSELSAMMTESLQNATLLSRLMEASPVDTLALEKAYKYFRLW